MSVRSGPGAAGRGDDDSSRGCVAGGIARGAAAASGGTRAGGSELGKASAVADGGNNSMSRRGAPEEGEAGETGRLDDRLSVIPRSSSERLAMKLGSSASERLDRSSEAKA
ncbi:MAG: hypothetical protein A3H97_17855 [Acidobacteria bacterium RIFCSPLOWO2_02_FULL_65_29]|nr:MAG: hypothetical protein A3H97_17855 [Acidobacteria bacterium RIFCSPLOWO2_02_FULL_65_29]